MEKSDEMRESMRNLVKTFFKLGKNLEEHFSEQALSDVRKVLDETAEKLEKINENLRGQADE